MIGYSEEKKRYRLFSKGKLIVSSDVIFDENESKSAEEVESILQKLETKSDKRNRNLQSQPNSQNWYEIEFPSSENDSSSLSSSPLAVHPTLLVATVLLTMTLRPWNPRLINKHQFTSTLFTMMVIFHNPKPVNINCQNGQFKF